jgi:hypothetical protein
MKIDFCDLCNESVPQADLEAGRAARAKGRVICARCNEIMRAQEGAAATGGGPGHGAPMAAGAAPGPLGAVPHGATPHVHVRPRGGGGAGTALALIALAATAGVGFWLFDRGEQEALAMRERIGDLRGEVLLLRQRLDEGLDGADARAAEARRAADERLAAVREDVASGLSAVQEQARGVETQLASFDRRLSSMQESVGSISRQDQELVGLQQKYTQLSADVVDLGRVLADLADEQAAVRAAAPPAETQPAWMGLLGKLSSPDDTDRWQAVIALGETRDPAVASYLLPVLGDADIFVRMAAARMLGDLRAPEAVPALIDALEDPEPSVREAVYLALKEITRRDLPFDALSEDPAERAKRVEAWRAWWAKEQERLGG